MAERPGATCRDERDALQRRITELEAENARLLAAGAELETRADVTARVEAERRFARLAAAVEGLTELFVLWDEDDRLMVCNERFRQMNARVRHTTRAGTPFREHIEAAVAEGLYPAARDREEAWLAERLERHRHPCGPFEIERQDGRWLLIHEQRFPDGGVATISTDITARKQVELALQEKASILEASFRTIPDGILVLDRDMRPVAWNHLLFEVLAIEDDVECAVITVRQDLRCALIEDDPGPEDDAGPEAAPRPTLSMTIVPSESERMLPGGRWVEARITPLADGGCVAVYRDISDNKRLRQELERQATTDTLTGVLNRRRFFETARQELSRAGRHGHPLSLLVLDIDHFKQINDAHGHAVGDAALRLVAQTCQRHLRRGDAFGRIGGEEFAAILPMTGGSDAEGVADKLRSLVAVAGLPLRQGSLKVTASIGVAEWPGRAETIEQLTDRADGALYQAKRDGRNRVHLDRRRTSDASTAPEEAALEGASD